MPLSPSSSSAEEPQSLASLITGANCLKTCGMEDIQFAARRASELFITIRFCAFALSSVCVLYILLLISIKLAQFEFFHSSPKKMGHLIRTARKNSSPPSKGGKESEENGPKVILDELSTKMSSNQRDQSEQSKLDGLNLFGSLSNSEAPIPAKFLPFAKSPPFVKCGQPANLSFFGIPNSASCHKQSQFPISNDFLTTKQSESNLANARN